MIDHEGGDRPDPPCAHKKPNWILRGVGKLKRYLQQRCAEKKKESATDRAARRTANATVAVAFFTIATVFVSALQFCAIEDQLEDARKEQRPWVSVKLSNLGSILVLDGPRAFAVLSTITKNFGHSPAKNIVIELEFHILKNIDYLQEEKRISSKAMRRADKNEFIGSVMFTGEEVNEEVGMLGYRSGRVRR